MMLRREEQGVEDRREWNDSSESKRSMVTRLRLEIDKAFQSPIVHPAFARAGWPGNVIAVRLAAPMARTCIFAVCSASGMDSNLSR
jgi:hypothetical protein